MKSREELAHDIHCALLSSGYDDIGMRPDEWVVERSFRRADAFLAACPPSPAAAPGWYCAQCQCGVPPRDVTYDEVHVACGRRITDDEPPAASPVAASPALLAQANAWAEKLEEWGSDGGVADFSDGDCVELSQLLLRLKEAVR